MSEISRHLPSQYLRETVKRERARQPEEKQLARMDQALDRFSGNDESLGKLRETVQASQVRSTKLGTRFIKATIGLTAAMAVAGVSAVGSGLQGLQAVMAALPFAAGAGSMVTLANKKYREGDEADLALQAIDSYSDKTLRHPDSRNFLTAYRELEPELQLPNHAEKALLDLTHLVGSQKAQELWPLASNYAQDFDRELIYRQLAQVDQQAQGQTTQAMWGQIDREDPKLEQRLALSSRLAKALEQSSSESYQQLREVDSLERVDKAFAGLETSWEKLPLDQERLPLAFKGQFALDLPPDQEVRLRVKAKSDEETTRVYLRDEGVSGRLCSGSDASVADEDLSWTAVELPASTEAYRLGTRSPGNKVVVVALEASTRPPKERWQQLLQCLQQPEGLEQLERFQQASQSWPEAVKLWHTLQNTPQPALPGEAQNQSK